MDLLVEKHPLKSFCSTLPWRIKAHQVLSAEVKSFSLDCFATSCKSALQIWLFWRNYVRIGKIIRRITWLFFTSALSSFVVHTGLKLNNCIYIDAKASERIRQCCRRTGIRKTVWRQNWKQGQEKGHKAHPRAATGLFCTMVRTIEFFVHTIMSHLHTGCLNLLCSTSNQHFLG